MDKQIGVYILQCNNGRYYVGSTNDKERRMKEHGCGYVKATKNIRPVTLRFFYPCKNLQKARSIEYYIKKQKSRVLVEQIIAEKNIPFEI